MPDAKAKRVHDFVETLGQIDRYIVMLYYADGLTTMEISRVLDLPTSRVTTRLEELRTQLTGLAQKRSVSKATAVSPSVKAYA